MSARVCQEIAGEGRCGGNVSSSRDGDFLVFRCDRCQIERVGHARSLSPEANQEMRLGRADIPARFLGRRYDEDDGNRAAVWLVRDWLRDFGERQLPAPAFYGLPSRGKSHCMAAVSVRLIRDKGVSVLFRSARALLAELQDYSHQDDVDRAWRRASSVDVLALDDLGAQRVTDDRHDRLADLIDVRYEAQLPILVATNFVPAVWGEKAGLDARTVSRLRSMTVPVELRGPDRRQLEMPSEPVVQQEESV